MGRRLAVAVLMIAVVGVCVWAGIFNYKKRQAEMQAAQQKQATLVKQSSNDGSDAIPDMGGTNMRGKAAPAFTLPEPGGKKLSLADFKGKPVVVNFWGTYCLPCKVEMPWFEEFSKKYAGQNLVVLGLDDEDGVSKADVQKAAEKIGVTYPILISNDQVAKDYGLGDYLPVTFYINKQGEVVEQTTGTPSKDAMESNIKKILMPSGM